MAAVGEAGGVSQGKMLWCRLTQGQSSKKERGAQQVAQWRSFGATSYSGRGEAVKPACTACRLQQ